MKDLAYCIGFVHHHAAALSTPGWEFYCSLFPDQVAQQITSIPPSLLKTLTVHNLPRNSFDFLSCAVKVMAEYIGQEIELMLRAKLAKHYFDGAVNNSFWGKIITSLLDFDPEHFKGKIESTRDPPLVFIPIPKIESNGCARSDLPIRSLIF